MGQRWLVFEKGDQGIPENINGCSTFLYIKPTDLTSSNRIWQLTLMSIRHHCYPLIFEIYCVIYTHVWYFEILFHVNNVFIRFLQRPSWIWTIQQPGKVPFKRMAYSTHSYWEARHVTMLHLHIGSIFDGCLAQCCCDSFLCLRGELPPSFLAHNHLATL